MVKSLPVTRRQRAVAYSLANREEMRTLSVRVCPTSEHLLANYARTDRDAARRWLTLRCVRLRPLPFGVVATGTSYREVYRLLRFIESHRRGACSAMISGSAETSNMDPS